jgi:hypothetical protein
MCWNCTHRGASEIGKLNTYKAMENEKLYAGRRIFVNVIATIEVDVFDDNYYLSDVVDKIYVGVDNSNMRCIHENCSEIEHTDITKVITLRWFEHEE